MNKQTQTMIQKWFDGLNKTDMPLLLSLFAPSPTIRNAANPPLSGKDASRRLLEEFFHRTSKREFKVIDSAVSESQVFAYWEGKLTFAEGINISTVQLCKPLTVSLRGVERFRLNEEGLIEELDIIHETTSVLQAARAATEQNKKEQ